jgi:predicted peptidase
VVVGAASLSGAWAQGPPSTKPADDAPQPLTFAATDGKTLPYLLLKPKNFDPAKKYPLVMFYHGAGERGDDNKSQWKNGIEVFQTPENRTKFPCFIVAPQCPKDKQWVNVPWGDDSEVQPAEPSDELKLSLEVLESVRKEFPIDSSRLYVMGLSMGGYATWDVITRYPDLFAAAVPICGGGDEKMAAKIKDLPIWAFHGAKDPTVPIARSEEMVKALKDLGADVKFTVYPEAKHDSWTETYDNPELFSWFLAHKRGTK